MNIRSTLYPVFLVFFICCFSIGTIGKLSAQNEYFKAAEIMIIPNTPYDTSQVSVRILGTKRDECVYLQSSSVQVYQGYSTINMVWATTNTNCPSNSITWDTTFSLGVLDAGAHGLYFGGSNYVLSEISNPFPFEIQATSCFTNGTDILVTNTNDEGQGSLRQAIDCANSIAGSNRIVFDLQGSGPDTIRVGETTGEPLPTLFDNGTIIDGASHQAYGNGSGPKVVLDGQYHNWESAINAIFIRADDCAIYGMEIINFPDDAIDVLGGDGAIIGGIGLGNVIHSNGSAQDFFPGNPGQGPWEGCGIVLRGGASNSIIRGNYIGTNYNQTLTAGNEYCGIIIRNSGDQHVIGGRSGGMGNIIAGNAVGISVGNESIRTSIIENQFYCNDSIPIALLGNANDSIPAPVILDATSGIITGTGLINQMVDVYLNATECNGMVCQGKVFLGSATVTNGTWTLNYPFANGVALQSGDIVTAIATDLLGNSSPFSTCSVANVNCQSNNGVITVTNTDDEGPGSLRAAINCANELAEPNTIDFDISGNGPHVIMVGQTSGEPMPALLDSETIIDGTTQTGFSDQPLIVLDGSSVVWELPYNALWVRGDACEIYALEIRNFPDDGIDIAGANNVIIGDAGRGNVIYNCGLDQDIFPGSPNTGPWNGCGILIRNGASGCEISGNTIGTSFDQTVTIGNEYCGILIRDGGDNNTIGGDGKGNVIANNPTGLQINGGSQFCKISQNQFFCNDTSVINLITTANGDIAPPVITSVNTSAISGTAPAEASEVEVFINDNTGCVDAVCQGKTYLGTVTVANQAWTLSGSFSGLMNGQKVTAVAIAANNNSSEFAACVDVMLCELDLSVLESSGATCGDSNGSFTLEVINGLAPFTFTVGTTTSTNPVFENLSSGNYPVTVVDANGCEDNLTITIGDTDPPVLSVGELINASCEMNNGVVTLIVEEGIAPFTFTLGNTTTTTPEFTNLGTGEYTFLVTDAVGCTDEISVTIENTPAPELSLISFTDASCGLNNGGFRIGLTSGTGPFQIRLDNAPSGLLNYTNMAGGTYTVLIVDANGCQDEITVTLEDTTPPSLSVSSVTNTTCGDANGEIVLETMDGTEPFLYAVGSFTTNNPVISNLSSGTYTITVTDGAGCTDEVTTTLTDSPGPTLAVDNTTAATCDEANGSVSFEVNSGTSPFTYAVGGMTSATPMIDNLPGGNYTATVTDANGCEGITTVVIDAIDPPIASIVETGDATCGEDNGSILVSATLGTFPYSFTIGGTPTNNPVFDNLAPGNYDISVTDATGCEVVVIGTVGNIPSPDMTLVEAIDATCGDSNGTIILNVAGGTEPYRFSTGNLIAFDPIFENMPSGLHDIVVEDANGCFDVVTVSLENTTPPILVISELTMSTCGDANGGLIVNAANGTAPYSFTLNGASQPNGNFSDLAPGLYTIETIDANGCLATLNAIIETTPDVELEIEAIIQPSCESDNGSITVRSTEGTAPYSYDIGNGSTSSNMFSLLSPGIHVVTVTDNAGCTAEILADLENEGTLPTSGFTAMLDGNIVTAFSTATEADDLQWDFGDGGSSTATSVSHEYLAEGNYTFCLTVTNDCGVDMYCEEMEVVLPLANFNIGGNINTWGGLPVALVEVSCTNQPDVMNEMDGSYLFEELPGAEDYTITPFKDINHLNGVTLYDLVKVREHLIFIDTLDSPYEYIAADVSNNGAVSLLDLGLIREMLLFIRDRFEDNTSWRFLPADYTFDYPSQALLYEFPESITVDNLLANETAIDFVAVKIGDLNNSNDPTTMSVDNSVFEIEDRAVAAGNYIDVPVQLGVGQDLLCFQAALGFDENKIRFVESLPSEHLTGTMDFYANNGLVSLLYYPETTAEVMENLEAGTSLFRMRFEILEDMNSLTEALNFTPIIATQMTFNEHGHTRPVVWDLLDNTVTSVENFDQYYTKVFPNPFNHQTFINFDLPNRENVSCTIYDGLGRLVFSKKEELPAGQHQIKIRQEDLNGNGIYFYQLEINGMVKSGKLLLGGF